MSEYGVPPLCGVSVRMRPQQLLATRDLMHRLARGFADAYRTEDPGADYWSVFFAVLQGLQMGVDRALEGLEIGSPANRRK